MMEGQPFMGNSDPSRNLAKRRSTRVAADVYMGVRGVDKEGHPFLEQRWTLEVSFHGCKFYTRYPLPKDTWLTIEIPNRAGNSAAQPTRARVAWLSRSPVLRGLFQVGVEFEAPGNIWGIANPPEDWQERDLSQILEVAAFEGEMKALLSVVQTGTYYQLLHTTSMSSKAEVRRSYYELMRKFHPDRHMNHAEWMESLHTITEAITLAYKTLSDEKSRQKYDEQLAASGKFMVGRQQSDAQKTAEECFDKARECFRAKNPGGTILWLRKAADLDPKCHKYHALLARALSSVMPLRREAVEHFEKALEIDESSTVVRFQLASLYEEMKLPWRARLHYEKILDFDADHSKARIRLHALDVEQGDKAASNRPFFDRVLGHSSKSK
jgi:tetratricopeptide (TPR) repeat protein